ncbi:TonB-dependent receptor [uncultured Sphingomonas sp.]|uniref:TonB-dependent receptor plug domain-containing protein n=1 Tax=uncultured Sphingomonas sp. TaxID=158754 RepID=UPI0025DA6AF9|nr:TonB-dependent receptor [uncultured Sphingomonas sp.]
MRSSVRALLAAATALSAAGPLLAQGAEGDDAGAVIVTGTRATGRTAIQSSTPVDVISQDALSSTVSEELTDELQQLVPSFNVQRLPAADGLAFVRPATLRGLSPDQTLVLVNGKRQHRSALLGTRGAQGVDLAQIPTFALGRVEVLRDGAAAQYGSDAIAGVINLILDKAPGISGFGVASQYYDGDGELYRAGAKFGTALPNDGFLVVTGEYSNANVTSRSIQRPDAIAFQAANPKLTVRNPVTRWGQPDREAWRTVANAEIGLGEVARLYGFGIYGESKQVTDFNWRNPGETSFRITPAYPGFDLRSLYPAGFTPRFGQKDKDLTAVGGVKGDFDGGLNWDLSAGFGRNEINYFMRESINASFGPESPTASDDGTLVQREFNLNLDLVYPLEIAAFAKPVNIAAGAERRRETYRIGAGDPFSYGVGPAARYGVPSGSSGFPGYTPAQEGSFGRTSYAGYLDVEATPIDALTLGGALRYEHYSDFGSNWSWKGTARLELVRGLALRGAYSTGFRAPTPGQSNYTRVSQGLDTNTLQVFTSGLLSPNNPISQLFGATALQPEESKSASIGLVFEPAPGFTLSADYYNIRVDDRFGQSQNFTLSAAQRAALIAQGVAGADSITTVSYYTNAFDTRTQGVDLVGSYLWRLATDTSLRFTVAYNLNDTKVRRATAAVSALERINIEDRLPEQAANASAELRTGRFSMLGRVRWYDRWTDAQFQNSANLVQDFGAEAFVDLSASYDINRHLTLTVGAENLLDNYPDKATFQASRGLVYSRNAPYDTDGGLFYARLGVRF